MANPNISAALTAAQKATVKTNYTGIAGILNFLGEPYAKAAQNAL